MDKLKEVDWRGIYKTATQKVKKYTLNLTDLELKVEEATNAETWGPHGSVMNQIADAAFDPENYRQIMGVLARRLQERDENWRMCYKALLLLEHLLKHGPGKIVGDVQSSAGVLDRLCNFQYKDPNMKDHGVNVRHRAKEILDLVNSSDRLRDERDKAKANRQKYRGVSADQMRSGGYGGASSGSSGLGGSSSFGRAGSDRYTAGTSGSLYGASSGGLGGASGGLAGGGALGGGGYTASRRTDSYDETEHDSHYISKRPPGGSSSGAEAPPPPPAPAAAAGGGGAAVADAVAATRARIERMKLEGDGAEAAGTSKKKLTDVRVDPKIAASLGLKLPAPAPPRAAAAPAAAAPAAAAAAAGPAGEIDLLGGLDEPAAPAAAPAPMAAPAAAFDPFAAPAAPAAAPQQAGWDAFGGALGARVAPPAAPVAAPLDLFGGLSSSPAVPRPADPFASFSAPAAAPPPSMAAAKPAPLPAVAAGVPASLPEDMFSDLTGIGGRAQQPMGHAPPAAPAGGMGDGMGGGWGAPAPLAAHRGGFGDFGAAPAFDSAPAAGSGLGGLGGLGGMPAPAQQGPPAGHARSGSRGRSVDFGSFSYSSAPQGGGASAADPFADLLK
ncbi:Clathrin interactor EPSIN 3 isoform A [Micractinium conductrix]|uniref:Clathrin interactor EPSIN 3 isoform A n=1 Tax=Micractinium conductrix TaxID=554055 RepID=A0A2P6V8I5_9CHLO|nr:Clathrin interactor EPSIN 3 isoform C [Micractinium conductrix]PSC70402.1 Clathrin interactor EPSIN 3 isoform B [Micractinium conductrix]PSC70403.1 Clathrin interactor EPSIN 3 isoform A [Micractinium conductrix]|eukprot:PSC70401.1 Clathrin interactor EPSIN 3 isoform C [Micractinium conductrix]